MGAGQIGGIATLLDIDFHNAAGFMGERMEFGEAHHMVHFLSHAMMFCSGSLIEAHVVLTAATCIFGEKYKFEVIGGTHRFLLHTGISRQVHHLCLHKGYNHSSNKYDDCCSRDNLALLVLSEQFQLHKRDENADYAINRLRYGGVVQPSELYQDTSCRYYGWGSRRNGFLIPLLIHLRRVKVVILPDEKCLQMFNYDEKFLCIQQYPCKSEKFGALCPDDVGAVLECSGVARGIMTTRLVDRPCGIGFLDLSKYRKFLTCGVDDARDVVEHDPGMAMEFTSRAPLATPQLLSIEENETTTFR